jgi:hypothetical protein
MARTPPPPRGLGKNSRKPGGYFPRDAAVVSTAARQQRNITRSQLLALGLDDEAIARRVRNGRLFRAHHGIYSVGSPPMTPLEHASAAVLACGKGAALSHGSAMTLWGFWRRWDEPFEVTTPGDRRRRSIKIHRSATLSRRDVRTQLGVRVTSPARTVFDMTPRLNDKQLKRTLSNAMHSPYLTQSQLEELLAGHPHSPAARRIGPLIGLPGTPPRSGWEYDFPAFCAAQNLPTPVMGAAVCGYVVDALFVEEKVIVELDSWEFHKDPIAFQTDRERDADTLSRGFVTLRITWERIERAAAREGARLRMILAKRRASLAHAPNAAYTSS